MPHLASSNDLEGILRFAQSKTYPDWPSQDPQERGMTFLQNLRQRADWPQEYDLLVTDEGAGVDGFLVLKKQLIRGITGDRESVVKDCYAPEVEKGRHLVQRAAELAKGQGSQFLTIEVSPGDAATIQLLQSMGFRLESHRISVTTGECRIPDHSPYQVRAAGDSDAFLIGVLNSTMLPHTLAAGRDYDLGDLTFRSMSSVMEQVSAPGSAGLVLTLGDEMVGHLLIDLHERYGYINDLALAREHWGGTAVRHLMRSGSRLLFEKGIPLFVGDVSAANRRAFVVAQRALGFSEESRRYGLKL